MIKTLVFLAAGGIALATAGAAGAATAKGYRVTYVADHGHYCVTPTTFAESERLGIAVHRTECHTRTGWATIGLNLSRS